MKLAAALLTTSAPGPAMLTEPPVMEDAMPKAVLPKTYAALRL